MKRGTREKKKVLWTCYSISLSSQPEEGGAQLAHLGEIWAGKKLQEVLNSAAEQDPAVPWMAAWKAAAELGNSLLQEAVGARGTGGIQRGWRTHGEWMPWLWAGSAPQVPPQLWQLPEQGAQSKGNCHTCNALLFRLSPVLNIWGKIHRATQILHKSRSYLPASLSLQELLMHESLILCYHGALVPCHLSVGAWQASGCILTQNRFSEEWKQKKIFPGSWMWEYFNIRSSKL